MPVTVIQNLQKSGFDLVSCQNPLVVTAYTAITSTDPDDAAMTIQVQGQSPADNTTTYTFNMAHTGTVFSLGGSDYAHVFRIDVTDIVRKISNIPALDIEGSLGNDYSPSRLVTEIDFTLTDQDTDTSSFTDFFMHGFNQVNNPDGAVLIDFADINTDAIISIVPGLVMPFFVWIPTAGASDDYYGKMLSAIANTSFTMFTGATLPKGLYELLFSAAFYSTLYTAFKGRPTEVTIEIEGDVGGVINSYTGVALKKLCTDGLALAWLNRYGTYSFLAFDRFYTEEYGGKHIGIYAILIDDIADVQSRSLSRGMEEVYRKITAVCENIPVEYLPAVEDLYNSMDIYLYTGAVPATSWDTADWLRVTIEGSIKSNHRKSHQNIEVTIILPEYYAQIR